MARGQWLPLRLALVATVMLPVGTVPAVAQDADDPAPSVEPLHVFYSEVEGEGMVTRYRLGFGGFR